MSALTRSPAWQALQAQQRKIAATTLAALFAADPSRAEAYTLETGEVLLDYSKHRIDRETMRLLAALAAQAQVPQWIERMFSGEPVNNTEGRAALHVALRSRDASFPAGRDVMADVRGARERMRRFVDEVDKDARITDVVNIGIGGSDLGPRMLTRALRRFHRPRPRLHFVSNIDPADLDATLAGLSPATTLFIVASKTFTTAETLDNARRARAWLEASEIDASRHLAAVTANPAAAASLGVATERVFPMWDWVGGRYSVWSAVGLPVALAAGTAAFDELLEGARRMDEHFRTEPIERNIPAVLALLEIWNLNFFGAQTRAVIPYCEDLRDLPGYLQQLEMESNGKRVDRDGNEVDYDTAPIVWGATGTPSQHSFHQLLHQGTRLVPVDLIVAGHEAGLAANALAQAAALAFGKPQPDAPHKALPGNRPSSTILLKRLAPRALGELIAAYEHKVFVEGIVWNVNSFDQWGVEHGKTLARALLEGGGPADLDSSTRKLLARLRGRD